MEKQEFVNFTRWAKNNHIYSKIIHNMLVDINAKQITDLIKNAQHSYEILLYGFTWKRTKEGYSWWEKKYREYKDSIK